MEEHPRVPCCWPGATIVCIGGGPSLTPADAATCHGHARVIAVNDAYRMVPWADVLFAADLKWWGWHPDAAAVFPGLKYRLPPADDTLPSSVVMLGRTGQLGLETDPRALRSGGHSGYAAINLAAHLVGPRGKIVLLGYDLQPASNGVHHWFGDHPDRSHPRYARWRDVYSSLLAPLAACGITIVNASRVTAITAIPRVSLEQALVVEALCP